ncbi:MAG: hypothetical protein J6S60_06800 [Oscillospiraceae bacterium]|nr:hypothetical protein [Oscillospiraceae bacterium]
MKESENKKKLQKSEEEKVSGGRYSIVSPGEGTPPSETPENNEPHDGGATYTW